MFTDIATTYILVRGLFITETESQEQFWLGQTMLRIPGLVMTYLGDPQSAFACLKHADFFEKLSACITLHNIHYLQARSKYFI